MGWSTPTIYTPADHSSFSTNICWAANSFFRRSRLRIDPWRGGELREQISWFLVAEFAGPAHGAQSQQFNIGREIAGTQRFIIHQCGAEIFLIVIAEDCNHDRIGSNSILG